MSVRKQQTTPPAFSDNVTITLPGNLVAQIDAMVGSEFMDREDFIRFAVRRYLEHLREMQNTSQPQDIG
jgi:metal-responsive CopG/Arc/MetJ family transcriptional regulator